jgi:anti-sigma factor RsiW
MVEGHHPYEEELAAYLLGALGDDEIARFEDHLDGCARCQADARWLRGAADLLPATVDQIDPPAELRERLLDTVRREADGDRRARERAGARPSRLGFLLRPATALAAILLALVAGVAGYAIRGEEKVETTTVAAQATPAQPGAKASVVRSGDAAVLRVQSLKPPRSGHVYEVWIVREGRTTPEPNALFDVRSDGTGAAAVAGGVKGVSQILVSMEPAGGSDAPTTKPVLQANL